MTDTTKTEHADEFELREVSLMPDGTLEVGGVVRGRVAKAGEVQADGTVFTAEALAKMATEPTIAEVAGTYPALEDALSQTPSHVHPPRINDNAGDYPESAITFPESVDDAIAGVPLRPSVAAVHAEINRLAIRVAAGKKHADKEREHLRELEAETAKESADLLELMRDAGIATAAATNIRGEHIATVTVVVRHDFDIVDLDAAVAMLTAERGSVPMTEPKVDTAAIKRIAKVTDGPIAGVVPTESAHLRWT